MTVVNGRRNAHADHMSDPDPLDRSTWPKPRLPFHGAAGRDAEEVARLYRDDGFLVVLADVGAAVTRDLRPHRVRLFVRQGRVMEAAQG